MVEFKLLSHAQNFFRITDEDDMGEAVGNDAVGRSEGAGFGTFGKDYPLRMLLGLL